MTNILLMNIPSGPSPTDYPPVGISRVIEGIDPDLNCNLSFVDLDYYRPSFEDIKNKIQSFSPQIIGFSAILTPAYSYLKKLSIFIKKNFPNIIQVLGGEMAVISNIILIKTNIDFCVTGESEPTFSNLITKLQQDNFEVENKETYRNTRGLAFLLNDIPYFTGYEEELIEIKQLNYELISKFTNLEHYMQKLDGQQYKNRIDKYEMEKFLSLFHKDNLDKKIAIVSASKGCVGKCTFCHRYFRGYKVIDENSVMNYIDNLTKKYEIGLIQFAEENFGSNVKSTYNIVNYLKEKKLNWAAGAVRAQTVNEEMIKVWKDTGCVHVNFGIESCSQKMLNVMEKRTTVEENLKAIRLCNEYKILTIIGLVIGMPGESEDTIEETIHNLSTVIPDDINMPYEICINYFQAVPGTPGYEYARRIGFIGQSLEEEEKYIESLYDVNANDIKHYLNFTDYEKEEIAYWNDYIILELTSSYIKKHGILNILNYKKRKKYKYVIIYLLFPKTIRKVLLKYFVILKHFGLKTLFYVIYKKIFVKKQKYFVNISNSLRSINRGLPSIVRGDDINTYILREGR